MGLVAIVVNSLWAGAVAGGMAVIFTLPVRYIGPSFICGYAGCFIRDLLAAWGMSRSWSTAIAAAVIVPVAVAIIRREEISPAVLIAGVLPLGALLSMFNSIIGLMKVSSLEGEALAVESALLLANVGKFITTSLAIALGLAAGLAIVRLHKGGKSAGRARL